MNFQDIKSNRTLQSVILLAVVIVALLLVCIFSVLGILDARTQYATEQQMLTVSTQELAQLQQMAQDKEKNEQLLEEYQELLPASMDQDVFLDRLSSLGNELQVDVDSVGFDTVVPTDAANRLPVTLSLSGSYAHVMELLERLSMDGQLIVVDQANISAQDDTGMISATANLSAYYQL